MKPLPHLLLIFLLLSSAISQTTNSIAPAIDWNKFDTRIHLDQRIENTPAESSTSKTNSPTSFANTHPPPNCAIDIWYNIKGKYAEKRFYSVVLIRQMINPTNNLPEPPNVEYEEGMGQTTFFDGLNGYGGSSSFKNTSRLAYLFFDGIHFDINCSWTKKEDKNGKQISSTSTNFTRNIIIPWETKYTLDDKELSLIANITWLHTPTDKTLSNETAVK